MLVVDLDTLGAIDLLHLVDQVPLRDRRAGRAQQVGGVQRAGSQRLALIDTVTILEEKVRATRELVLLGLPVIGDDRHLGPAVGVLDLDPPRDLANARHALRLARLEQLDDARQPVRDVGPRDAARVEGAHRELRAGLADRLSRDVTHSVADVGLGVGGQTVA